MDYSKESNYKKKARRKQTAKRAKNKIGIIIFRSIVATLMISIFTICGAFIGAYMGIIERAPMLTEVMKPANENYTSIIYDEKGEEIDRLVGGENREFVSIENIPRHMQLAFVAIEDERFYSHNGIDLKGVLRAVSVVLTSDDTQGASTITQQLIKNKLKIKRNSFVTKFQEQYLAIEYEKNMTEAYGSKEAAKNKILELYLNSIGLGYGQVGVQAAAMRYYNKDISELTLAESAVIAAITQNPTLRDPIRRRESNQKRQHAILDKMLELEFITEEEYKLAYEEDVYSKIIETQEKIDEQASYHSYFVDQIITEIKEALETRYGYTSAEAYDLIYNGGLKIYATIDTEIQNIVDKAFLNESIFPEEYALEVQYILSVKNNTTGITTHHPVQKSLVKNEAEADAFIEGVRDSLMGADDEIEADRIFKIPQPQAGMAIIDYHTGKVLAVAGGRGEKQANRSFNRATEAARQPGSVFKVLASFAPALDLGYITAATVIDDVPFTVGNYSPNNWYINPAYRGLSTVREGVRDSMNVLTVKNMYNTGIDNCFNYLRQFGFTTLTNEDKTLSTALGGITYGVTQLETAAAYGAIANGGIYNKPIFFTQVLDHDNNVILENTPNPIQVLKKTSAYILTDMMKDVVTVGTGNAAQFKNIQMPIAGKTGTTSEDKDLFFAAYTPYYVASIYLGYDMPRSTAKESKRHHMQIWSYIMEQIHESLPYKDFEVPDGIVYADICRESGKLAVDSLCGNDPRGSTIRRREIFASGTQPTDYCNVHVSIPRVDTSTNYIANEYCPENAIRSVFGIVRPEPYSGSQYVGDQQYELSWTISAGIVCPVHSFITKFPPTPEPEWHTPVDDIPSETIVSEEPHETDNNIGGIGETDNIVDEPLDEPAHNSEAPSHEPEHTESNASTHSPSVPSETPHAPTPSVTPTPEPTPTLAPTPTPAPQNTPEPPPEDTPEPATVTTPKPETAAPPVIEPTPPPQPAEPTTKVIPPPPDDGAPETDDGQSDRPTFIDG